MKWNVRNSQAFGVLMPSAVFPRVIFRVRVSRGGQTASTVFPVFCDLPWASPACPAHLCCAVPPWPVPGEADLRSRTPRPLAFPWVCPKGKDRWKDRVAACGFPGPFGPGFHESLSSTKGGSSHAEVPSIWPYPHQVLETSLFLFPFGKGSLLSLVSGHFRVLCWLLKNHSYLLIVLLFSSPPITQWRKSGVSCLVTNRYNNPSRH